ncbi:hypothetical protein FNF31_02133 [Cafeteria roenbergensis]|uniref:peptidylprolyl isomerase n=3 Tax=Cafeteria roenbergensis TaxID=33653 RepID=A0A5A8DKD2_CAFRO|nr:hypothetical protein FNF31_02133 [Cafeteria roenbergensis]
MREALQAAADGGARGARSEELASATEFDTGAAFSVNTTFKPKRCSGQLASPGHRVRIHYVGKFVHDSKVFASSFHTGSVPYRMVLGDPSELEAWNVGIEGMCPNERRSIVSPWNMAYGAKGNAKVGVPPKADVKFFIELVSVSERPAPGFSHLAKSRSEDL